MTRQNVPAASTGKVTNGSTPSGTDTHFSFWAQL